MAKTQFGISAAEELSEEIDELRETDETDPQYENRSEFIERVLTYGLAVERLYQSFGYESVDPWDVRSVLIDALQEAYEDVEGEPAPNVDGLKRRPYDFERERRS